MVRRWFPWRFLIRAVARAHGFIDPIGVLASIKSFSKPSQVAHPLELVRAGVVFHARGLLNTQAIQHNLDWVWPYWVTRQFDPLDESFVPRAFTITHVNLTHRNWTAIGIPDSDQYPILDPRGLLTPYWDTWSLDVWILSEDGDLIPARLPAEQGLDLSRGLEVVTSASLDHARLITRAAVNDRGEIVLRAEANGQVPGFLVFSVRPYNPEGISFVKEVSREGDRVLQVNTKVPIEFDAIPERVVLSNYERGDVFSHLSKGVSTGAKLQCPIGMATAACCFALVPGESKTVHATMPFSDDRRKQKSTPNVDPAILWSESLKKAAKLSVAETRIQQLYEIALRTIVLLSPGEVYPGPYTYRRFWFRDAVFILYSALVVGLVDRVKRAIAEFPKRQTTRGYFLSQEGEWDSNGEVLWFLGKYHRATATTPTASELKAVTAAANWIEAALIPEGEPFAGLLPPGFSAEHLGPSDYYYWDTFWAEAGLRESVRLFEDTGRSSQAARYRQVGERISRAIWKSIEETQLGAIPAAPSRRMDAGAIGSIVCSYPLQLVSPMQPQLQGTLEFLLRECTVNGAFFQDMVHSGLNPYLTLHLAQVLLRANDPRYLSLLHRVAELSSPTGQWPEAIHPRTGGGCMGDGQHAWAAAEWITMIRNCFMREEGASLVLGAGVPPAWVPDGGRASFGPSLTDFGSVTVDVSREGNAYRVSWEAVWHEAPQELVVFSPSGERVTSDPAATAVSFVPGKDAA